MFNANIIYPPNLDCVSGRYQRVFSFHYFLGYSKVLSTNMVYYKCKHILDLNCLKLISYFFLLINVKVTVVNI